MNLLKKLFLLFNSVFLPFYSTILEKMAESPCCVDRQMSFEEWQIVSPFELRPIDLEPPKPDRADMQREQVALPIPIGQGKDSTENSAKASSTKSSALVTTMRTETTATTPTNNLLTKAATTLPESDIGTTSVSLPAKSNSVPKAQMQQIPEKSVEKLKNLKIEFVAAVNLLRIMRNGEARFMPLCEISPVKDNGNSIGSGHSLEDIKKLLIAQNNPTKLFNLFLVINMSRGQFRFNCGNMSVDSVIKELDFFSAKVMQHENELTSEVLERCKARGYPVFTNVDFQRTDYTLLASQITRAKV